LKQDLLSIDPRSQNSQSENDSLKHKLIYEGKAPLKLLEYNTSTVFSVALMMK